MCPPARAADRDRRNRSSRLSARLRTELHPACGELLESVAEVVRRKAQPDLRIYSDEIYEHITFDGFEHFSNSSYSGASHVNATVESWQSKIVQAEPWFVYLAELPAELAEE